MNTKPSESDLNPELAKLVEADVINRAQAIAVQNALHLGATTGLAHSRRSMLSEAITYIGGAVIVISAILLLSTTWEALGQWGRPSVLALAATLLGGAGIILSRTSVDDARRRLCSTLFVASAFVSAVALGLVLNDLWVPVNQPMSDVYVSPALWVMPTIFMLCTILGGLIAVLGYKRSNSALGVIAIAIAIGGFAESAGMVIWWQIKNEETYPFLGFVFLFIAAVLWSVAVQRRVFTEQLIANALGVFALIISVEGLRDPLPTSFASVALVVLGLVMMWKYLRSHEWVYLAGGIASMLLGGVELLTRYVSGPLGSLASMVFGIVILVVGLRLFKEKQS